MAKKIKETEIKNEEAIEVEADVTEEEVNNQPSHRSKIWLDISFYVAISLYILAIISYFVLGIVGNYWYNAWILIFVPDVIASIFRCIYHKRFSSFSIAFFTLGIYFFLNMVYPGIDENLWGNLWYVFLLIPIYYIFALTIDKKSKGMKLNENFDDEEE